MFFKTHILCKWFTTFWTLICSLSCVDLYMSLKMTLLWKFFTTFWTLKCFRYCHFHLQITHFVRICCTCQQIIAVRLSQHSSSYEEILQLCNNFLTVISHLNASENNQLKLLQPNQLQNTSEIVAGITISPSHLNSTINVQFFSSDLLSNIKDFRCDNDQENNFMFNLPISYNT